MADKDRNRKSADDLIDETGKDPVDPDITTEFKEAGERLGYAADRWKDQLSKHNSRTPDVTGGDLDADWARADVGEEAPGATVSTPDQDIVEEYGAAVGVTYQDNEPLKSAEKLHERDRKRWELDPASSDDYQDRTGKKPGKDEE